MWALITNALPLRVYLFDGGVVPFGAPPPSPPPNSDPMGGGDSGGSAPVPRADAGPLPNAGADLIVNLWRLDRSQVSHPNS